MKWLILSVAILSAGCGCRSSVQIKSAPVEEQKHQVGPCCTPQPKQDVVNGCVKQENGLWKRAECKCPKCKGACGAGSCPCGPEDCMDGCRMWCPAK